MGPVLRMLNPRWRPARWALKTVLLALVVLVVLFPYPMLLVRDIQRWLDIDALPDPDSPALDRMAADLTPLLAGKPKGPEALAVVQKFVYDHVPYANDWVVWGVADYVPTVEEVVEKGREDCDGRAVLGAALLRRFGYEAHIVSDLSHVWVWTPQGQTMSPMKTASGRTYAAAAQGRTGVDWGTLVDVNALVKDWPTNLAYGVAIFPPAREAIILVSLWALLLGRRVRWAWALVGLGFLVNAWLVMRATSENPWKPNVMGAWLGWASGLAGVAVTAAVGSLRDRLSDPPVAEDGVMGDS